MRLQLNNGQLISLGKELGIGGEGTIYQVQGNASLAAKVYHPGKLSPEQGDKLHIMHAHPPKDPMADQGHPSIAWPVDLLEPVGGGRVNGFLMPLVKKRLPIFTFYNPRSRRQKCPLFNYAYLHRTARNLAIAFGALHQGGYVIGDVNESNILVADSALVTLVDTDSFQVRDRIHNRIYRCPVGKPEFTPPELQGETFRGIDRTPEHDRFGLAVLIFQLLMEGIHPFAGKYSGRGDPPLLGERIKAGHFPYGTKRVPFRPMPVAPAFDILTPELQKLFSQCFEAGHLDPQARPDAQTWSEALTIAEHSLVVCSRNSQHYHARHLQTCPWCDRTSQFAGLDPFPSRQVVQSGQHLLPAKKKRKRRPAVVGTSVSLRRYPPASATVPFYPPTPLPAVRKPDPLSAKMRSILREAMLAITTVSIVTILCVLGYSLYNRPKPFADAVEMAEAAAIAGQQANSVDDWIELAKQWQQAAAFMAAVPQDYAKYEVAQNRVKFYQQQSEVALQQARYLKLEEFLASGLWQQADQLTWEIIVKSVNREVRDYLKRDDIEKLPCSTLKTIDQLWVEYSEGNFGFSVQQRIWDEVGTLDGKFGELVGWRRNPNLQSHVFLYNEWLYYNELNFHLSAPTGHLPADVTMCGGRGLHRAGCGGRVTWTWRDKFLSRVTSCRIYPGGKDL